MALFIGILAIMITNTKLKAAQTEVVDVILTIQDFSVLRVSTPVFSLVAVAGRSKISEKISWRNTGNGSEDFAVKVGTDTGSWQLVSTQPGPDQFRISGIWHHWAVSPSTGEFQTDDILTQLDQTSSATKFLNDNEPHEVVPHPDFPTDRTKDITILKAAQMAVNVPPGGERNLYLKIDFPSATSTSGKIKLLVTAIPGE